MVALAAESSISTKQKPRKRPVSRSFIMASDWMVPYSSTISRTSVSVVLKGKFPTYNFLVNLIILLFLVLEGGGPPLAVSG